MNLLTVADGDLKQVALWFVLGHQPGLPDAHFSPLSLNGQTVTIFGEAQFPGRQGIIVSLGLWEPKSELEVAWTFRVPVGGSGVYLTGFYFDRFISKLTRLQVYRDVSPMQVCDGRATIKIP